MFGKSRKTLLLFLKSADDAKDDDTADSYGVSTAGNGNVPIVPVSANTIVSDADKPIYSKYTKNLAVGHNTTPQLNTS